MTSNKSSSRQAETTFPQKSLLNKNEATGKPVSSYKWNEGSKLEEYEANK